MMQVIDEKMIDNCLINKQSIKDAFNIFGPSIPNIEYKTTQKGQGRVNE